jgi:hypothetical protein
MDMGGFNWALMTVVGGFLLGAVILWAALRNRTSRATREESERATHRLYQEEDRAHRGEGDNVP